MNQKIINWLKYDRSFKTGSAIYMAAGSNLILKTTFNRQGESTFNSAMLLKELILLSGLHQDEVNFILASPVSSYQKASLPEPTPVTIPTEVVPDLPEETPILTSIPLNVLKSIRLRDEFPFLNNKDCPSQLKILVNDMLSAYDRYKAAHEALFTAESEAALLEYAKETVENYLENRMIWDELNHFKEHHEVLGSHPIFAEQEVLTELSSMNAQQLSKEKTNLGKAIGRLRLQLEKADKPELNFARTELIASKERLLVAVNKLLESR